MHIISKTHIKKFAAENPQSLPAMEHIIDMLQRAKWKNVNEVRAIFPHADEVEVKSGRKVVVLNAGGNNWRVVVSFHYDRQKAFVLKIMSHAEYSRMKWKKVL
ncbi:TPA: hypothetical protein DDW35_02310 [Candidatus Sumerlaeota bacterium]|jgi:mRNA interferase HigB|nr:hypothetical protein [Candidatus Sumerlaeota bacterium]